MLKDEVRTKAYRDALLKNSHLLKGKTVLDVGCGTGILSMFAAQAGAKHVYAVDNSDMADTARQIIEANGFSDRITVYKAQVEEVQLPVEHVDCIVSEWMGYCLLYEAMFDSIIFARDKWLRPGGMLLPDKAGVYLCGIEDAKYKEEKIHFWDRVYGFDMSCVKGAAMFEPLVDTVDPQQICTSTSTLWEVDLLTVTQAEMRFDSKFQLQAVRNDYLHAVVAWFDVGFTQGHTPLWLSTSPRDRPTHWRQTVLYLHDVLTVRAGERGERRAARLAHEAQQAAPRLPAQVCFRRGGGERRAGRERQRHPLLLDALSAPARPRGARRRIARAPRGAAQAHRARARRSGARGAVFPPSVTLLFCTGVRAASDAP